MYGLPNGKQTKSSAKYIAAWRKFAEPLANATNTTPMAFDPGITLAKPGSHISGLHIPTWFVAAFNEGLKEKNDN